MKYLALSMFTALLLTACTPEVGTEKWCDWMDDKPKGDWTANEAKDYGRYCVLNNYKDEEE